MPAGTAWIDTGALLALASPRDQYHARAVALAVPFTEAGGNWVSSVLVLAELQRHLLYLSGPALARAVISRLLADPATRWLEVSAELIASAVSAWLERFYDQPFSLTDAVSFELMQREGLTDAFAFDRHYVVAGFRLLS